MKIYNEYQNVHLYEIQHYIDQGYEPIHFYSEHTSYANTQHVNGSFMGNSISFDIPVNQISIENKVVMGRTNAARILYEKKLRGETDENNA